MKRTECEFEADVLAAVMQSQWPYPVDAKLRDHASHCEICSVVGVVAAAIDAAKENPAIPDPGRVWWLAQLRVRREAATAAGRSITVAQVLAFACAMGLLGACFGATSTWFQSVLRWMGSNLVNMPSATLRLAAGMAALIIVVPTAVYLAIRRD